ncbi:hypothetical protein LOK49_LG03G03138 [Camellia lanceoleosa]|uniref:Uncharacterized protein n=1 Tax=Camellia lanceoleosa TaxID=1840588 RepID=A0ACC0I8E4_9ERIC|nr:hypothetical protein LOK49_LG03G03138 [Camellia lanceoleosa]
MVTEDPREEQLQDDIAVILLGIPIQEQWASMDDFMASWEGNWDLVTLEQADEYWSEWSSMLQEKGIDVGCWMSSEDSHQVDELMIGNGEGQLDFNIHLSGGNGRLACGPNREFQKWVPPPWVSEAQRLISGLLKHICAVWRTKMGQGRVTRQHRKRAKFAVRCCKRKVSLVCLKDGKLKRRDASPILGGDARKNRKRLGDSGVIEENTSPVKRVCSEFETDQNRGKSFPELG